jgi:hypothetical protein
MARFGFAFFDSGVRWGTPDAQPHSYMRDLTSFLSNPFDDVAIGMARLVAFTNDHLQRMVANNPSGELGNRITATTSSLALVVDCLTQDSGKLGIRKAAKLAKDDFREGVVPKAAERIEAALIASLADSTAAVLQTFPQGRSVLNSCRDDQLITHLSVIQSTVAAQASQLPPVIVSLANDLKANWTTLHNASEAASGGKTLTQEGKRLARENLQLMLYLNLVKLMEMFPRQPQKLELYMKQYLLETSSSEEEEEPAPAPTPPTP